MTDDKTTRLPDNKTTRLPDNKTTRLPDNKTTRLPDNKTTRLPDNKTTRLLLWLSLFLGWCTDWLFHDKQLGVSWPLFILLILVGLWWIGRSEGMRPAYRNLWLVAPLLFFAGMAMIRANSFLTTMNVLASLAILSYLAYFYAAGRVGSLTMAGALSLPIRVGAHSAVLAGPALAETVDVSRFRKHGRRSLVPLLRGGLLALPVLFVFTLLLASADIVFADYLDTLFEFDFLDEMVEWIWRGFVILLAGWALAGGFMYALRQNGRTADTSPLETILTQIARRLPIGFIETVTVLVLVDLLFAAFTAVQFTYLFGGRIYAALENFTYADYARRGFFELVWVAILSLSLSLSLNWITRRENKRQIKWFNVLSSLMIGFVLVMLVSAFKRMQLYESTFGYTELRLIVYVFMSWLAVLLGWFLLTLWLAPHRFAIGLILTAVGFLATLNLINPDAFIARQNIAFYQHKAELDTVDESPVDDYGRFSARYTQQAQRLDIYYLTTLSDDAVPQLIQALTAVHGDDRLVRVPTCYQWRGSEKIELYKDCQATRYQILWDELNGRYQSMTDNSDWQRWQSFHLSHWHAYNALNGLFIGES